MADGRESASLDVQAKEIQLILDEREAHVEILENRRKDPVPAEIIGMKRLRLEILRDIRDTVQRAADARARIMSKRAG